MQDKERDWDVERAELEGELAQSQSELRNVREQLAVIMDAKLSMEMEIAAYRKLLEGEDSRYSRIYVFVTFSVILRLKMVY